MTLPQKTHRTSSLKQKNKKHNTLGHKSKRQLISINKGKVNDIPIIRRNKIQLSKEQKRNRQNQKRKHKNEETLKFKRNLGTDDTAPFLVLIVPMSENIKTSYVIDSLCTGDSDAICDVNLDGITHIGCKRFKKRLSFIAPPVIDRTSILDAAKISDTVLFVWNATDEDIMEDEKMLLTIMKAQGLPTVIHAICGLDNMSQKKKLRALKELKKDISVAFPEQSKLFSLDNRQETLLLLRQLAEQKKHEMFFRDKRSHLLAEDVQFVEESNTNGILKVTGYIRGQNLSPNGIIHIPGWEDYQIECIECLLDPHLMIKSHLTKDNFNVGSTYFPDSQLQSTLDSNSQEILENLSDEEYLEEDKIDPFDSELDSDISDVECDISDIDEKIYDSDDSFASAVESFGDCNEGSEAGYADALNDFDDNNYDSHMDYEAEMIDLKAQEVQDNKDFPDEIDTPFDELALHRFKKYRGLESFRTSPWEHYDGLPANFRRIFTCKNYNHLRKTIFKTEHTGVEMGCYVRVSLKNVSKKIYEEYVNSKIPIVLFSLLEHEHQMSMLHLVLKSHKSGHIDAIKSKERLVFHVGIRRFTNCPIFSEHSSGNKFLFNRYFHPGTTVIASMYAPVAFKPCPVSVYKENYDGTMNLLAIGSVHSANERRVMCKRILLSGHPFKIKPQATVVRYMFFSRDDIEYFKKISLRSKWGARGKILGPLGTHGHMKCSFKEKLNSQDVIFLSLYKRVFPKWKYQPLVNRLKYTFSDHSHLDEYFDEDEPGAKRQKKVRFSDDG